MKAAELARIPYQTMLTWIDQDSAIEAAIIDAESTGASPSKAASDPKRTTPDRWERMRREAAELGSGLWGIYQWVDAELQKKGFPPTSPWWLYTLRTFYESGKRWLVLRVGRGGGKSSTLCRVAVVEAIFVRRKINPGDIGIWSVFSVDMSEAAGRLVTIKAILDALGIRYEETMDRGRPKVVTEDAYDNPIEFRVYPASVGAASGFTGVGNTCDEEAKWKDEKTGANPATEVLRAVRPTLGRLGPKKGTSDFLPHGFRCSSAFSEFGTHFDDVNKGDTKLHHVARIGPDFIDWCVASLFDLADAEPSESDAQAIRDYALALTSGSPNVPTWLANPTEDPIEKRTDEPDLSTFLREYGSKPSSSETSNFFDGTKLDACAVIKIASNDGACYAAIDTGAKRNAFALAIVRRVEIESGWRWRFVVLKEWIPSPGAPLDLREIVLPEVAKLCKRYGCDAWWTDPYAGDQVEIVGARNDIATIYVSTDPYAECYRPARDALYRGEVSLSGCDGAEEMVRQLKRVRQAPGDASRIKIIIPEDGALHGDLGVAAMRALAHAGVGEYQIEPEEIERVPGRYADVISNRHG